MDFLDAFHSGFEAGYGTKVTFIALVTLGESRIKLL